MSSQRRKQVNKQKPFEKVHIDGLLNLHDKAMSQNLFVESLDITEHAPEESNQDNLYTELKAKNVLERLTSFKDYVLMDIYFEMKIIAQAHRKRGPSPSVSLLDSFIIYLIWMHLGTGLDKLSAFIDIPLSTLSNTIHRVRPILLETLKARWWEKRIRPKPIPNVADYSYVALLVDATSIEVFRPKGHFSESKCYFDDKNYFYALKKEVAVLATPPHYAMFCQPAHVGSEHDYKMHKEHYESYSTYLNKTISEQAMTFYDQHSKWAILGDSGYTGPEEDTSSIRRIAIPKHSTVSASERAKVNLLKSLRVNVERFFGRLKKTFPIFSHRYEYDHSHFDEDFDIAAMLINEHLKFSELFEHDNQFEKQVLELKSRTYWEKKKKRKEQQDKYAAKRKRMRVANEINEIIF